MNNKTKVGYGKDGFKPGAKLKTPLKKPKPKKTSTSPKNDVTKIPGFKFGRGTE